MAPLAERIEAIKATEVLKNLILGKFNIPRILPQTLTAHSDQVRAIHGPSYPTPDYTFSVITSCYNLNTLNLKQTEYCAQAVDYIKPNSLVEWKLLAEGETGGSTQAAMESLYRKMQEQVDLVAIK
jgi:hypothetical protein